MITVESLARQTAQPTGPGGYLRQLLQRAQVTQEELAGAIGTSRFTISQIISGRRAVTPAMALKLSRGTGTSVDVWVNLQRDIDLWEAYQDIRQELEGIEPVWKPVLAVPTPAESELEKFAHALFSERYKAIEDAAVVAENATASQSPGYAVALSIDSLQDISDIVGHGNGQVMLGKLAAGTEAAALTLGAEIYHYGFDTLVLLLPPGTDDPVNRLQEAFSAVPASINFEKRTGVRFTISGGIAHLSPGKRPFEAVLQAIDQMDRLRWRRSSERAHVWSLAAPG